MRNIWTYEEARLFAKLHGDHDGVGELFVESLLCCNLHRFQGCGILAATRVEGTLSLLVHHAVVGVELLERKLCFLPAASTENASVRLTSLKGKPVVVLFPRAIDSHNLAAMNKYAELGVTVFQLQRKHLQFLKQTMGLLFVKKLTHQKLIALRKARPGYNKVS